MTAHAEIAETHAGVHHDTAAGIGFLRRPANGPALVLLHGIGSNARSFLPTIAALPAAIDAIAWNAPGYAGSAALASATPAPQDYAAALRDFLDALGLRRIVLAGHSLGALFAARFAADHPDRVAALALLSPALGYRVAKGAALPDNVQSRIDEIAALGPQAFAAKRAARLVGDAAGRPDVVDAVRTAMASVDPAGYAQAVHALGAGDLIADAARITVATCVAVGTHDVITPPDNARAAYAALKNPAGFHDIARAGHALPQEQPGEMAIVLAELIRDRTHVES